MDSLRSRTETLSRQFEGLEQEAAKTPLASKQLESRVRDVSLDIFTAKRELDEQIATLKLEKKDVQPLEKMRVELQTLGKRVDALRDRMPRSFKAEEKRNPVQQILDETLGVVVNRLNSAVRGQIFHGATRNKRDKTLPARLSKSENELKDIRQKQTFIMTKLMKLEADLEKSAGLPEKKVKELKHEIKSGGSKLAELNKKCIVAEKQVSELSKKMETTTFYEKKGDKMRAHCQSLGGTRVTITTPDKVNLDGMYLDGLKFRQKLADAGCSLVTFKGKDPLQDGTRMHAISLSQTDFEKSGVMDALKSFHAFADDSDPGAGWQQVKDGPDVLLVRASELPKPGSPQEAAHPFLQYNSKDARWEVKSDAKYVRETNEIDTKHGATGTVIIGSGNAGVYEQHKTEAAFFLLRNMNVVMFNFRGYGASEGEPTEEGLKLDMESVYQLAKSKSGHADKQILFKALCMSGGPAAYVASKHPETNILLDQTYSNFKTVVADNARSTVQSFINKMTGSPTGIRRDIFKSLNSLVSTISSKVAGIIAPDFNTAQALSNNKGQKAIFYTHDDDVMELRHVENNIKAVAKAGDMDHLLLIAGPGIHGESLIGIRASREDYAMKLDQKLQVLSNIRNELMSQAEVLRKEGKPDKAAELDAKAAQVYEQMTKVWKEIRAYEKTATGQSQMELFLNKAHLSGDIIRPDTSQIRTIHSAQSFANAMGELEKLKSDLALLGSGFIMSMTPAGDGFMVEVVGTDEPVALSKDLIARACASVGLIKQLQNYSAKLSQQGHLDAHELETHVTFLKEMDTLTARIETGWHNYYDTLTAADLHQIEAEIKGDEDTISSEENAFAELIKSFDNMIAQFLEASDAQKAQKLKQNLSNLPGAIGILDNQISELKELESQYMKIIQGELGKTQEDKEVEIQKVSTRVDTLIKRIETRKAELQGKIKEMEACLDNVKRMKEEDQLLKELLKDFAAHTTRMNTLIVKLDQPAQVFENWKTSQANYIQVHEDLNGVKEAFVKDKERLSQHLAARKEAIAKDDSLSPASKEFLQKRLDEDCQEIQSNLDLTLREVIDPVLENYATECRLMDNLKKNLNILEKQKLSADELNNVKNEMTQDLADLEKVPGLPPMLVSYMRALMNQALSR